MIPKKGHVYKVTQQSNKHHKVYAKFLEDDLYMMYGYCCPYHKKQDHIFTRQSREINDDYFEFEPVMTLKNMAKLKKKKKA